MTNASTPDTALIPNSFQTPNIDIDVYMELLTPEEFKCLMFAVRHIYGWRNKLVRKRGRISMSAFVSGYQTAEGQRYGGTGLSYPAVDRALNALVTFGLLIRVGKATQDGQEWEIGTDVRIDLMQQRHDDKRESGRKRTQKARALAVPKQAGTQSDLAPEPSVRLSTSVVSRTEGRYSVGLRAGTQSDLGNQTHIQTHLKNNAPDGASTPPSPTPPSESDTSSTVQPPPPTPAAPDTDPVLSPDGAADDDPTAGTFQPYPCTAAQVNDLIAAWWEWTPKRPTRRGKVVPPKAHFGNRENRAFAQTLIERGVAPGDMVTFLAEIQHDNDSHYAYLRSKEMTFCYACEALQSWIVPYREQNWWTADAPRVVGKTTAARVQLGSIEGATVSDLLARAAASSDVWVDVPLPYITPHQAAAQEGDDAAAAPQWEIRDVTDAQFAAMGWEL